MPVARSQSPVPTSVRYLGQNWRLGTGNCPLKAGCPHPAWLMVPPREGTRPTNPLRLVTLAATGERKRGDRVTGRPCALGGLAEAYWPITR